MTTTERIAAIREALEAALKTCNSFALNPSRVEQEVDHALCVEVPSQIETAWMSVATLEAEMSAEPVDPDAHIKDPEAYLASKQERAKGTDFDGIEARKPAYAMSKDYEALYELLKSGGMAVISYGEVLYGDGRMVMRKWEQWGDYYMVSDSIKEDFVDHCHRLKIQWIAPTDLAGVVEAGDAMQRWIEYAAPNYCDEQDRHNAGRVTEQWSLSTKHLRPNT